MATKYVFSSFKTTTKCSSHTSRKSTFWNIKNGAAPRKSDQKGVKSGELLEILMCSNLVSDFGMSRKSTDALYLKIRQP